MTKLIARCALSAVLAFVFLPRAADAQMKVGTVDLSRIFQDYYKTKEAETRMNESRLAAKKEMDDRIEARAKLLEDINTLNRDLEKKEFSAAAREEKIRMRDDKIAEARGVEREINEFKTSRERQLGEQAARLRNAIVEDIMKVVNERSKSGGYDLLFDKSGHSFSSVPVILYSRESFDFTADVVTTLNKTKPAAPRAEARPDPTPKR